MLYKIVAVFLCYLLCVGEAFSNSVISLEDRAIKKQAKSIRDSAPELSIPKNRYQDKANLAAKEMLAELRAHHQKIADLPVVKEVHRHVLFFGSYSLGKEGLKDLFLESASVPDSVVVLRGIVDESDFAGSILKVQAIAASQRPVANVVIDPTLFRKFGVSRVPTIIWLDESNEVELARVSGLSSSQWLDRGIRAGKRGDFGVRGDVEEILERDLVEVMQDKVAAVDWDKEREEAIDRFWLKQYFIALPRATKSRKRVIDPTVVLSSDLEDADGGVIVPVGTKINPLHKIPFTQALVVFDPTDKQQIAVVERTVAKLDKDYPKVTLIATQFHKEKGWVFYENLTELFERPVFKLTPEVFRRFELEKTPSVVWADKNVFYVEEIAVVEEER